MWFLYAGNPKEMLPPGGSGGFLSSPASVPVVPFGECAFLWAAGPSQSALLGSRNGLESSPHLSPGLGILEQDSACGAPVYGGPVLPFVFLAQPPFQSLLSSSILNVSAFSSPGTREGVRALKTFILPLLGILPKEII